MILTPSITEVAFGMFLHDIGKLLQRAHPANALLPSVQAREGDILPLRDGRYSHRHALWSEQFFELGCLQFPTGVNANQVRHVAVYHHEPAGARAHIGAIGALAAEADRLSAGMDRRPKDEAAESDETPRGRDAYRKTAMDCPFSSVDLGLGKPARYRMPLRELTPDSACMPAAKIDGDALPAQYAALWQSFRERLAAISELHEPALFAESLLSASARFLSMVPSSTMDQPDISLHDHSRAATAIAVALYRWHERAGSLNDEAAIRDRSVPKFRFLAGDLSGIQNALFRLANQQVRGVNRILRARSFLFGMLTEAAALLCRDRLDLPVFSMLENAGGRFLLLAADVPGLEETVDQVRSEIDSWMFQRYFGELALNLALSPPFAGNDLMLGNIRSVRESVSRAIEHAKLTPFQGVLEGVIRTADYSRETCQACGARPATRVESLDDGLVQRQCTSCAEEDRLGRDLPRVTHIGFGWQTHGQGDLPFFGGLRLDWHFKPPRPAGYLSLVRVDTGPPASDDPFALRYFANYVPRFQPDDGQAPQYEGLSRMPGAEPVEPGAVKTFEHLACDALRPAEDGTLEGEPFLAVLKADVDRLGAIFSGGIEHPSAGRLAGVSRLIDYFFTAYLPNLLRRDFPDTYTVYAGGDDLLLIGPWNAITALAVCLQQDFTRWTGQNPNITLSAAIEVMKAGHPLNRVARSAERRLEAAKEAGRNRVCAFADQPLTWNDFAAQSKEAEELERYLRAGILSQAFAYRVLHFAGQRAKAEPARGEIVLEAATWRARWGYQLVRQMKGIEDEKLRDRVAVFLNGLLGLNADLSRQPAWVSPRAALTIAIYNTRSGKERRP